MWPSLQLGMIRECVAVGGGWRPFCGSVARVPRIEADAGWDPQTGKMGDRMGALGSVLPVMGADPGGVGWPCGRVTAMEGRLRPGTAGLLGWPEVVGLTLHKSSTSISGPSSEGRTRGCREGSRRPSGPDVGDRNRRGRVRGGGGEARVGARQRGRPENRRGKLMNLTGPV